ncbi:MAG: type II secretion system F family protein [Planctomycetes bacterium]|nr:type II secretion system F family protein [Planctomycetota bacterium]
MTTVAFQYVAIDSSGKKRRGTIDAHARGDAYKQLIRQGITPIRLHARTQRHTRMQRGAIKLSDLVQFTHELAVLLEAGISVVDGLSGIAEQSSDARFRATIFNVAAEIQAGSTVSAALAAHQRAFGEVYVETVRAAESSGNMVAVLNDLAEMLETQMEMRRQMRKALTYPAMVTITLGLAVAFLLAFVVPKFSELFSQRGVELPLLTRVLIDVGHSFRDWWWLYGLCSLGGYLGVRRAWGSPQGRRFIDRMLHRVPHLRQMLVGVAVARFARVFGLCIGSGLQLVEALELAARAAGRPMLTKDIEILISGVRRGERLTTGLASCEYLPNFAKRLLCAGEDSAQLQRMSTIIARHYDRETEHLTSTSATIIEPILIVLLSAVVLVVALAIFVPMWDLAGLVG